MVQVLADGPLEQRTAAGLVLSLNGVGVVANGDSEEGFEFWLTMPDGSRHVVHAANLEPSNLSSESAGEIVPTLDEAGLRRMFIRYGVLFVIAALLAYAASQTSGAWSIALATLAGILSAVALWSTVFMFIIRLLMRAIKKPGRT
jgi:hypothetical protein